MGAGLLRPAAGQKGPQSPSKRNLTEFSELLLQSAAACISINHIPRIQIAPTRVSGSPWEQTRNSPLPGFPCLGQQLGWLVRGGFLRAVSPWSEKRGCGNVEVHFPV